jgi:hypothetical protein
MRRTLALFVAFLGLVALAPRDAAAGVPIPCTGEHVVSVVETPPGMRLPSRDGKGVHVDLGYLFKGCLSGKWVAYPGSGSAYYDLPEPAMRLILASAGLTAYPSPPSFLLTPSASWAAWLWILVGAFVVIGTLLSKLAGLETLADAGTPAQAPTSSPATSAAGAPRAGTLRQSRVVDTGRTGFGRRR